MKTKKVLVTAALCAGIVMGGIVFSGWFAAFKRSGGGSAQAVPITEEKLPNVAVQPIVAKDIEDILYLTGIVEPWEEVTISAETRGKLELQSVDEGDRVTKGQELIRVNTTTIQATMDQATAEFTSAERELKRIEELRAGGISSPQEYDKAIMARDMSRARLRLSEIQLAQSVVVAPFDGIVDMREKEEGEFVDVGTPLIHLVQVDRVKIVVGLPEREVANFAFGDEVALTLDAYPDRPLEGTIFRIATSAERSTRTFPTEIEVPNPDGLLRPGMIARVKFVRQVLEDAIVVPLFAVMSNENGRYVMVEQGGVASARPVEVGFMQGEWILVTDGLVHGDRLIVSGQRELRDGARVAVPAEAE